MTALFILMCSTDLGGQGLYQDELFQAAGSFAYVGAPAVAAVAWHGLPVLNNSYVGAIKTAFYGVYLRVTGRHFGVISWRLTGILLVATGLLVFTIIAGPSLGVVPIVLFFMLLLSDAGVVLSTRHDYGPTALALALRLVFIAVAIRAYMSRSASLVYPFVLGLLVGMSVFEKLSSVVLVCPLLIVTAAQGRLTLRRFAATGMGGLLGSAPLAVVNIGSYVQNRTLVSLSDYLVDKPRSVYGFLASAPMEFLSLGTGSGLRTMILGQDVLHSELTREIAFLGSALVIAMLISIFGVRIAKPFQVAVLMFGSYASVAVAIYAVPRHTTFHHHIITTPFQYAGVALAAAGLLHCWRSKEGASLLRRAGTGLLAAAMVPLAVGRLPAVVGIERDLLAGRAGPYWHHAFTELGRFAQEKRNEATFIAADWGVGAQIYCLSDAAPNLVHEVFWNYRGSDDLLRVLRYGGRPAFYLVYPVRSFAGAESPAYVRAIREDVSRLSGWREVPLEAEARRLTPVIHIQKFAVAR